MPSKRPNLKCAKCGTEFHPNRREQKYCSRKCGSGRPPEMLSKTEERLLKVCALRYQGWTWAGISTHMGFAKRGACAYVSTYAKAAGMTLDEFVREYGKPDEGSG